MFYERHQRGQGKKLKTIEKKKQRKSDRSAMKAIRERKQRTA